MDGMFSCDWVKALAVKLGCFMMRLCSFPGKPPFRLDILETSTSNCTGNLWQYQANQVFFWDCGPTHNSLWKSGNDMKWLKIGGSFQVNHLIVARCSQMPWWRFGARASGVAAGFARSREAAAWWTLTVGDLACFFHVFSPFLFEVCSIYCSTHFCCKRKLHVQIVVSFCVLPFVQTLVCYQNW